MAMMTNTADSLQTRFRNRINFLVRICHHDGIKFFNGLFFFLSGLVLIFTPNYFDSSPRLKTLAMLGSEIEWGWLFVVIGLSEIVLLLIMGQPPLFAHTDKSTRIWRYIEIWAYGACGAFYFLMAGLITVGGVSLGTVCYGLGCVGCCFGAKKAGMMASTDPKYREAMLQEAKRLAEIAALAESETVTAIDVERWAVGIEPKKHALVKGKT